MRLHTQVAAVAAALIVSACATVPKNETEAASPAAWGALLNTTDYLATAGRHAAADSALVDFAQRNPGTRAAEEVTFWRALYKLDPRSSAATREEGRRMMDSYASSTSATWYRGQANVIRLLARELADAYQSSGDTTIVAGDSSPAAIAARDRVIRTQRAEIARLNAELERIKRRLATPSP